MDLRLSKHFCENWEARTGKQPDAEEIQRVINESTKIQHCRDLRQADGSNFRMLAFYWHPEERLFFTVDQIQGVAVSVYTETYWKKNRKALGLK